MPSLRAVIWCAVSTKAQAVEEEKDSLEAQERDARALCQRENMLIVDVLRVDGHSRRYVDIHECARDMAAQGIIAFKRLLELWQDRAFDVLICRDGSRFARTQALHAYVVERTIDIGARLYSLSDGWIDSKNYRMFISMSGYKAAADVDSFVALQKIGKEKRVQRGLPMVLPMWSHKVIRDSLGKALHLEIDETYRLFWMDLAELLLYEDEKGKKLSWRAIAQKLISKGHVNPNTGLGYMAEHLRYFLYHPQLWGNSAMYYNRKPSGRWVYDSSAPVATGITIYYDQFPAIYTGELAEKVKDELTRRLEVGERKSLSGKYMFTGLLVCPMCGRSIRCYVAHGKLWGWRCLTGWQARTSGGRRVGGGCDNAMPIRDHLVQEWFAIRLREAYKTNNQNIFLQDSQENNLIVGQLNAILKDKNKKIQQLNNLASELANAETDRIRRVIHDKMAKLDQEIGVLEQRETQYASQLEAESVIEERATAFQAFQEIGPDEFWSLPPTKINKILRGLLGKFRVIIYQAEVKGLGKAKRLPRNPKQKG
jgi:hypothetical protein